MKASEPSELHVVCVDFADAERLGQALRKGALVRVTLNGDRQANRRIVDFCSGAAFVLDRRFERLADDTYLVHPTKG